MRRPDVISPAAFPGCALPLAAWGLAGDRSTSARARGLTCHALTALGASAATISDAGLAVAELAANAVRHAHGPYELRLYHFAAAAWAVIEIVDGLAGLPVMPDGPAAVLTLDDLDGGDLAQLEGGRGLHVVWELSGGRCGAYATRTRTTEVPVPGKAIWFACDVPAAVLPGAGKKALAPREENGLVGSLADVRLTAFWERMRAQFGEMYAASVAQDYVIAGLGDRTVNQALADGVAAVTVWRAVCDAFELPERVR